MAKYHKFWLLGLLVLVAIFLRLYRISDHFDFLADQGSAGVVIYEVWREKKLPLTGPTVSTGQKPGPAYYYLVAIPLLLSGFYPPAAAVFFSLLGVASVYLIFIIGSRLYGWKAGYISALLYAVSQLVVSQNRGMWNPTLIPFFVILIALGLTKIIEDKQYQYWVLVSVSTAIVMQLHYSNIFTFLWMGLSSVYLWLRLPAKNRLAEGFWRLSGVGVFVFVFLPFLIYEYQQSFSDVRELILMVLLPESASFSGSPWWWNFYDISSRLARLIVPLRSQTVLFVAGVAAGVLLWDRSRWNRLFVAWFGLGVLFASFYSRTVYDHYLLYIYPLPFFLIGALIGKYQKLFPEFWLTLVIGGLVIFNLFKSDIFVFGNQDYSKTQSVAKQMIQAAAGRPFSFTIISSRSFSDYHYRFFFTLSGVKPEPVVSRQYPLLYLICEQGDCPTGTELVRRSVIDVMCFEHHCRGQYPKLFLDDFSFIDTLEISGVSLYRFTRKIVQ